MNTAALRLRVCVVILALVAIHFANADDSRRELKEDRYYDRNGELTEVISYYLDAKGRKVRHGDSVKHDSFGSMAYGYRDGQPFSARLVSSTTHALSATPFTLTTADSIHEEFGVELLDIAADGTTRIRATATKVTLSAKPGEYFVSEEFGKQGLQLSTASAAGKTATFIRASCETIITK